MLAVKGLSKMKVDPAMLVSAMSRGRISEA